MDENNRWNTYTKIIVMTLLIAGTTWLVLSIRSVLTALVMAALLAYLFDPVGRMLSRKTLLSRAWAARVIFICLFLLLAAIPTALGAVVAEQFHNLEREFLRAVAAIEKWVSQPIELLDYHIYPEVLVKNLEQAVANALSVIPVESLGLLSDITTNLLWVLLFFFGLYYLMKDGHKLIPWLIQLAPTEYQSDYRRLLSELDEVWSVFLRVQILMFIILGILMGAGFLLVIWLFRSGLIPFSPLLFILLIALVVTLAQQIDNLWLRPQLMGKSLHMHPGLVFVGLTAALMVGGFLWAFFVVPLMGTVKVLGRYIYCRVFDLPPWRDDMEETLDSKETESDPDGLDQADQSNSL